jgi:hypothetical protein
MPTDMNGMPPDTLPTEDDDYAPAPIDDQKIILVFHPIDLFNWLKKILKNKEEKKDV